MSSRRVVYCMSQFKSFSNLDVRKMLVKENTDLNFIVYFTKSKSKQSLKHIKKSRKWWKIQVR